MRRRKFISKFKIKAFLEGLKGRHDLSGAAQKYEINPNPISTWKQKFLEEAGQVFTNGKKAAKSETEQEKELAKNHRKAYGLGLLSTTT